MTAVKIEGKVSTAAADALMRHADWLYNHPSGKIVGITELSHVERTEPAPDEDRERSVKLRLNILEIASPEQEEALRQAMRALYLHRTAQGTLTEDMDIDVAKQTLRLIGDRLADLENARLRVALRHWADYAQRAFNTTNATATELRHELDILNTGLEKALSARPDDEEEK